MIVVVTGGRTFGEGPKGEAQKRFLREVLNDMHQGIGRAEKGEAQRRFLREVLNDMHQGIGRAEKGIDLLIEGGADGAEGADR